MKTTLQKTILIATLSALFGWSNIASAQWTSTAITGGTTNSFLPLGNDFLVGNTYGVYKLTNNGGSYTAMNTGFASAGTLGQIVSNGSDLFVSALKDSSSYFYHVWKSSDNAANWTKPANTGMPNTHLWSLLSVGSTLFAGNDGGKVFRSIDNAENWTEVGAGTFSGTIKAMAAIGTTIFVSKGSNGGGVYRSTDNGDNWIAVNNGLGTSPIYALWVDGTKIYTHGSGGIYVSSDNGSNWTVAVPYTGLTSGTLSSILTIGTNIFVGIEGSGWTQGGVHLSKNGGNFTQEATGDNYKVTKSLFISGSYIYNGTANGGVLKRPLSDWGIASEISEINDSDNIQIFPNPTTGKCTIINNENIVSVEVYDILGEKIHQLINSSANQLINASTNQLIDLSNQPSGIYFVQIKTGEKIYNQRIIKE